MTLRFRRSSPSRYLIFRGKTEIGKIVQLDVSPSGRATSAWSVVHRKRGVTEPLGNGRYLLKNWEYVIGKRFSALEHAKVWAQHNLAKHGYVEVTEG